MVDHFGVCLFRCWVPLTQVSAEKLKTEPSISQPGERFVFSEWERAEACCLVSIPLCVGCGDSTVDKSTALCSIALDHATAATCEGESSAELDYVEPKHIQRQVS